MRRIVLLGYGRGTMRRIVLSRVCSLGTMLGIHLPGYMPGIHSWVHHGHTQHGLALTWTTVRSLLHRDGALGSEEEKPVGEGLSP